MKSVNQQPCCPKFQPLYWDEEIIEWKNKKFIVDHVLTFLNIPVNFGGVMKRLDKKASSIGVKEQQFICLSDHKSKWGMDVYLSVDKEIPGIETVSLSGKFYFKVYEGTYNETPKWINDYNKAVQRNKFNIKRMFMWYTTCPKCAKKYGKNYVVIVSQIE